LEADTVGLLDYFKQEPRSSASIAKERLQIVVSHERAQRHQPDYLPKLQQELIRVIAKYVEIDPEDVNVQLDQNEQRSVLELNISLPKTLA
jgi:cell division topological specificity factor